MNMKTKMLAVVLVFVIAAAFMPFAAADTYAASGEVYTYWCGGDETKKSSSVEYTDLGIIMWPGDQLGRPALPTRIF